MPESTSDIAAQPAAALAEPGPRRKLGLWLAVGSAIALLMFFCWVVVAAFTG